MNLGKEVDTLLTDHHIADMLLSMKILMIAQTVQSLVELLEAVQVLHYPEEMDVGGRYL